MAESKKRTQKEPIPLKGFLSADEMVERGAAIRQAFSREHLWTLVALGLMPHPIIGLPISTKIGGVFGYQLVERLEAILRMSNQPLGAIARSRPELELGQDTPIPESKKYTVAGPSSIAAEMDQLASSEVGEAIGALAELSVRGVNSAFAFLGVFVSQSYFPTDASGRAAKYLCQSEESFGWGHDAKEIQAIQEAVKILYEGQAVSAMTLDAVLSDIDELFRKRTALFKEYFSWRERVNAPELIAAKVTRDMVPRRADALAALASRQELWKMRLLRAPLRTLVVSAYVALLVWGLDYYSAGLRLFSYSVPLGMLLMAFLQFRSDYKELSRKSPLSPRALSYVDSVLSIVVAYAAAYWSVYKMGGMNVQPGASFWDFLYFSAVTISTTGYGDILPITPFARFLAVSEMLVGLSYTIAVFGLVMAKLSAKATASPE